MRFMDGILALQAAAGSKAKAEVMKQYASDSDFCRFLKYALDPTITFHLSEASLSDCKMNRAEVRFKDIFAVCELLSSVRAMNDCLLHEVRGFLGQRQEPEKTVYTKLLAKTLRLGVTAGSVNKIIPGLIHEWDIQQAFPIDKYPLKDGVWFSLTQKLNGVRATYCEGQLFARSGVPYEGLAHILSEIEAVLDGAPMVLDGELTLKDKGELSDNEAFRVSTGIINSESENKTTICYTIFDALPAEEFLSKQGTTKYRERRKLLDMLSEQMKDCQYIHVLPVLYSGTDQSMIPKLLDQMVREDKEGLMVNLDVPYQCRRHRGILKVKRFYTMDLPIIGVEEGSGRLAGTLGALVLDYKGNEVRVGSGFTDEERKLIWDGIISIPEGTLCEVKYKEISYDKNTGAESLQFPVFVRIRDDKKEVSYG